MTPENQELKDLMYKFVRKDNIEQIDQLGDLLPRLDGLHDSISRVALIKIIECVLEKLSKDPKELNLHANIVFDCTRLLAKDK